MKWFKFVSVICAVLLCGSTLAEVNINTAGEKELVDELINIGPVKAAEIIRYRDKYGPFKSVNELVGVKGIGMATVEKNRHLMTVEEKDEAKGKRDKPGVESHQPAEVMSKNSSGKLPRATGE